MAELSAYYEAFGFEPKIDEAADHLAVQLGFLFFLRLKHAHALLGGECEAARITSEAFSAFLRDHVAVQAEPASQSLAGFAPAYLSDAGRLILDHASPSPRSEFPLGLFVRR